MKKFLILFFIIPWYLSAQPKEEVRAVWITTAYNLDWPRTYGRENQEKEIVDLLDAIKKANFNTVFFQVRARGDLVYPSAIEPWSKSILNRTNGIPGYDPLKFIINEAHKRGLEIHAWWNVFKVFGKGEPEKSDTDQVINKHPEFCRKYDDQWWIDPGIPAARAYLLVLASEMLHRYDLDGIHLDYIRYPNPDFNDDDTYRKYGKGKDKNDWRRDNVTDFVESLYDSIQSIRPNAKLGCAPLGIYKNGENGYAGWEAFDDTYQDPVKWIDDKKLDYVSPQIYWKINSPANYSRSLRNWKSIAGSRQIYPGLAAYKTDDNNWPLKELTAQIDSGRNIGVDGQVFFRARNLIENNGRILSFLKKNAYHNPAAIPAMPWKDNIKPLPPTGLTSFKEADFRYTLYWTAPTASIDGEKAYAYNIYISRVKPVDTGNPENFLETRIPAATSKIDISLKDFPPGKYFLCVTSLDRGNNESIPSNNIEILIDKTEEDVSVVGKNSE